MFFDFHHHHKNYNHLGIYNKVVDDNHDNNRYFSIGLHPKDIKDDWKKYITKVHLIAQNKKCLSIGECGLDYIIPISKEKQVKIFKSQIQIAESLQKPLILHCVRAFNEIISLCKHIKVQKIIHGFNKRENIAQMLINNGFYLSFGSSIMNNISLQNSFRKIPNDYFFLETDNSEISIEDIYNKASELRNISINDLQNIINDNLNRVFRWRITTIG